MKFKKKSIVPIILLCLFISKLCFTNNLYFLDLTTHYDAENFRDSNKVIYKFSKYGQKADLRSVLIKNNFEFTHNYFADYYKTTFSKESFFQAGTGFSLTKNTPLITRNLLFSAIYGKDGFNTLTGDVSPNLGTSYRYRTISTEVNHLQELTNVDRFSFGLSYQYYLQENEGIEDFYNINYSSLLEYNRDIHYNWQIGLSFNRAETIDQNRLITILNSSFLTNNNNLTPDSNLTEHIGVTQFSSQGVISKNITGGIKYTFSYGQTSSDIKVIEAGEGDKKLPDEENLERIDKIINPSEPDVFSLAWKRDYSTFNVNKEKILADIYEASWLHSLEKKSSITFNFVRTDQVNDSTIKIKSYKNSGSILYSKSLDFIKFAMNRSPEQTFNIGASKEYFKQDQYWSDHLILTTSIVLLF